MKTETIRNLNIASLIINLILMMILVYTVFPNIDKAEHDPLNYGAKIYQIDSCTCFKTDGTMFFFNSTNIWVQIDNSKIDPFKSFRENLNKTK